MNEHRIFPHTSLDIVSSYIRGPAGSMVRMGILRNDKQRLEMRIQRARVPGQGTEMLGALFQVLLMRTLSI